MTDKESKGKAHDPVRDWIALRVMALASIPLALWLVYSIVDLRGADYQTFRDWLSAPLNAGLMILLIVVSFWHAALGTHEIIEDYVHKDGVKHTSLCLKKLFFLIFGFICVVSVLKIAL